MIVELKCANQVSVKQKIETLRRVEGKERKENIYTPFFSYFIAEFIELSFEKTVSPYREKPPLQNGANMMLIS